LGDTIEIKAKELLGADLLLRSRKPFHDGHQAAGAEGELSERQAKAEQIIKGLPGERAVEVSFMTMIFFPRGEGSRLVNVRAVDPAYPFYGNVETRPADAWEKFGRGEGVILEAAIAEQFGMVPGDIARIGNLELPVSGVFIQPPPAASAFAVFSPAVFLPRARAWQTGAIGIQSFPNYRVYFRDSSIAAEQGILDERQKKALHRAGIRSETVEERKKGLSKVLDRLYSFLSLIGFVALLLGGVGIASAMHVHISRRLKTVATLRCLGCSPARATAVFLAQGMVLGAFGSLAGAQFGIALQQCIPRLFLNDLPFEISLDPAPAEILRGIGIGFIISVSFVLLPLLNVRRVSPLSALRGQADFSFRRWRDPFSWIAIVIVIGALTLLATELSPSKKPLLGIGFMVALGLVLFVLWMVARAISWLARRLVGMRWPYVFRQGLANLYRPRNQTTLFQLSAGLGVCLIVTLILVQDMLITQLGVKTLEGKADTFLINVRPEQTRGVLDMMESLQLDVEEDAPIVLMKLSRIKGKLLAQLKGDKDGEKIPEWTRRRDFRSTYRADMVANEKIIRGEWIDRIGEGEGDGTIPVSVEEGIAKELKVDVGDTLTMSSGQEDLVIRIANVRSVEWGELGLNFFFVFPEGAIDHLRAFNIMTTRTGSGERTGELTRKVVKRFPNVTLIDASAIIDTVSDIVGQVGWVIRFMALFTVLTGIIILFGTILSGKRNRIEESVLLRTLGASESQILRILITEYAMLGLFAGLAGALLSGVATWMLAIFVFDLDYISRMWPMAIAMAVLVCFTVIVGLLLSRGISRHPPLEILRSEAS
ncbi:MAG: FtsX-like permease family protein, partial [Verrucomicrobiaceae bacterium]|nr:FtsX-like permease family protein [Verrucomicrobiaceae bacterium]